MAKDIKVRQISPYIWEVPKTGDMRVPGRIFADKEIIDHLLEDIKAGKEWNALEQIVNVATLPGIQKASIAMSDVHPGYGFPIGGVGAFDIKEGVITAAGVGFDINCGVRTLIVPLTRGDLKGREEELAEALFQGIPAGLGSTGDIKLNLSEIDEVLIKGAKFAVERGYGFEEDLKFIEEGGAVSGADPKDVSLEAKQRQFKQIGTLGSGNHYLEVQYVEEVYDETAASAFGISKNQIVISIHCGSRGLGHQIGTDYLKVLEKASRKYGIPIREKELVAAPFESEEGRSYFSAVKCGINCAFANRQAVGHLTRKVLNKTLGIREEEVRLLYDIGHNTAKLEKHNVNGEDKELIVHRKGSTRAFGPGREEIPEPYRKIGQPVLVGGTMGTHSYILKGTDVAMELAFGSSIHGAGRMMSRVKAKKKWHGKWVVKKLREEGIIIKGHSLAGVAEEAPGAYKEIKKIAGVVDKAGISTKVAMLKPIICIKG